MTPKTVLSMWVTLAHGKCIEPRRKFIVQSTCREFATVLVITRSSAVIDGQRVSASRYVS